MSVSLLVLRLEVADHSNEPIFSFNASGFCARLQESSAKPQPYSDDLKRHCGARTYQDITIETYQSKVMDEPSWAKLSETVIFNENKNPEHLTFTAIDNKYCDPSTKSNPQTDDLSISKDVDKEQSDKEVVDHPSLPKVLDDEEYISSRKGKKKSRSRTMSGEDRIKRDVLPGTSHTHSLRPKSASPDLFSNGGANFAELEKQSSSSTLPATVHFFSGNPSVETTEGIIHLYKDNQMTSLQDDIQRSEMICMMGVPATQTTQDLIQYLSPILCWVENLKIIRDKTPSRYMVLVKFKSQKYADEFYQTYNNQRYNSFEPETCHLVYVARLETVKSSEGASLPISGLTELPVCPVCLERMDESVDGILTILCNHSFHSSCLAQWGDTSCPVCRYIQTPEQAEGQKCFQCDSEESLWICLICGHVGCGRYVGEHAYLHFQETQHTFSMQLGNNRVWDYAGDNYVHRLITNKGDGKLVQVDEGGNLMQDEKLDSITLEYTYLLTSQLESQRHYFEEKMAYVEQDAFKQVESVEARAKKAIEKCSKLDHNLTTLTKEKGVLEKKNAHMNSKMAKLITQLKEEKEMNHSLQQNQAHWQEKVANMETNLQKKDEAIKDLQDQLRDVMFFLQAQDKLSKSADVSQEELDGSTVEIRAGPSSGVRKKAMKKGR